jgi:flagellar assembly factor FliW
MTGFSGYSPNQKERATTMADSITIQNSQFGALSIDPDKIITFPEGILGFEDLKRYSIQVFEDYEPFHWLIAVDDSEVLFPIISPKLVKEDYSPVIHQEDVKLLGAFEDKDLLMYLIVTLGSAEGQVTANLKGPVFINQASAKGQQVVLDSDAYPMKYVFLE